jgi:hypothetical protein
MGEIKDFVHERDMSLSMAWLIGWESHLDYATAFLCKLWSLTELQNVWLATD